MTQVVLVADTAVMGTMESTLNPVQAYPHTGPVARLDTGAQVLQQ